ncbi:MAG: hypothetical protein EOP51_18380 [Sphingobacteriales bacterium]|nr:MAG: hypothetical protein EOP51_18380 [Sphingobacteriales bacterium]
MIRLCFLLVLLWSASTLNAQQASDTIRVKSRPAPKYRGANPNIKKDVPSIDVPVARPTGVAQMFIMENWSTLTIKIYVDSSYRGTIEAWGEGRFTLGEGEHRIYMVSVGGTREWSVTVDVPVSTIGSMVPLRIEGDEIKVGQGRLQ